MTSFSLAELDELLAANEPVVELVRPMLRDATVRPDLRAEVIERTHGIAELEPDLLDILNSDSEPEIVFWTIFALAGSRNPTPVLIEALEKFVDDERVVDPKMAGIQAREATIGMEARWAIRHLNGEDADPEWMAS